MPRARDIKADTRKLTAILLNAGNDTNGNPRRVYVLIDKHGRTVDAIDEGYAGWDAVTSPEIGYGRPGKYYYPRAIRGPHFDTTPREYRERLRYDQREAS